EVLFETFDAAQISLVALAAADDGPQQSGDGKFVEIVGGAGGADRAGVVGVAARGAGFSTRRRVGRSLAIEGARGDGGIERLDDRRLHLVQDILPNPGAPFVVGMRRNGDAPGLED